MDLPSPRHRYLPGRRMLWWYEHADGRREGWRLTLNDEVGVAPIDAEEGERLLATNGA